MLHFHHCLHLVGLINHELSTLADYFKANELSVNVGKTNFIVFTKRRQQGAVNVTLDGENTSRKEVNFLGVFVDQHLSCSKHVKHCKTKIVSTLYALKSSRKLLCENSSKILYYSLNHRHLCYECYGVRVILIKHMLARLLRYRGGLSR